MAIPSLLNVPKDSRQWNSWSFTHKIQHDNINRAILAQKNQSLTTYILDPINFQVPSVFLQNNGQIHLDVCSALGVNGTDLTSVNWQNEEELTNWIYQHWLEHSNFNSALGL